MKITAIRTFVARFGNRPRALIKVETDEGLHGWGEAYSTGPDLSVKPVADYLFELIGGEDPRRIEYIMMKLMQEFRFPPGGVGLPAISALDHALWDISGKAAGLPVYMLLGGSVRDRVRVYRGIGGRDGREAAESAHRLNEEHGFTAFKTSPYQLPPDASRWGRVCSTAARYFEEIRAHTPEDWEFAFDPPRQDLRARAGPAAGRRPGAVRPAVLRGAPAARAHPPVEAPARADAGAPGHRREPLRALRVPRPDRRQRRRHHPARHLHLRGPAGDAQDRRHRRGPLRERGAPQPDGAAGHGGERPLRGGEPQLQDPGVHPAHRERLERLGRRALPAEGRLPRAAPGPPRPRRGGERGGDQRRPVHPLAAHLPGAAGTVPPGTSSGSRRPAGEGAPRVDPAGAGAARVPEGAFPRGLPGGPPRPRRPAGGPGRGGGGRARALRLHLGRQGRGDPAAAGPPPAPPWRRRRTSRSASRRRATSTSRATTSRPSSCSTSPGPGG